MMPSQISNSLKRESIKRTLNLSLRVCTLTIRFYFIFFIARFFSPETVGSYGLFVVSISFTLYAIGLDFYQFVSRAIPSSTAELQSQFIKSQAVFALACYAIMLPIMVTILDVFDVPEEFFFWFAPVLIIEHINQELYRIFVALDKQLTAGVLMFVRQGLWCLLLVWYTLLDGELKDLQTVYEFWFYGGVCAAVSGAVILFNLKLGGWRKPVMWRWLMEGIFVCLPLLSTLAIRAIVTTDRYWMEFKVGQMLLLRMIFMSIAGTLIVCVDALLFCYSYPKLVTLQKNKDFEGARKTITKLLVHTLSLCASFAVLSVLLVPYFLDAIGLELYQENLDWYY